MANIAHLRWMVWAADTVSIVNLLNDFQESLSILYDEADDSYSIESIINNIDQFNWLLYKKRY